MLMVHHTPSDSNENKKASPKRSHDKEHKARERSGRARRRRSPSPELPQIPSSRNTPKEWRYHLKLTLEELFLGTDFKFRITRYLHSNSRKKNVSINVSIPPGCSEGNEIRCVGAGNYCKDDTLQDVIFVIEELSHNTFTRVKDDLIMEIKIPWVDSLEKETGEIMVEGIDGEELWVSIPYRLDKEVEGEQFIMGGGMPVRVDGRVIRRGDLIIK
jgi:DnaJ-class molecular chaperone